MASEPSVAESWIPIMRNRKRDVMTAVDVRAVLTTLHEAIVNGTIVVEPASVSAFRVAEAMADRSSVAVRAMDALHDAMAAQMRAYLATCERDRATTAFAEGMRIHTERPHSIGSLAARICHPSYASAALIAVRTRRHGESAP